MRAPGPRMQGVWGTWLAWLAAQSRPTGSSRGRHMTSEHRSKPRERQPLVPLTQPAQTTAHEARAARGCDWCEYHGALKPPPFRRLSRKTHVPAYLDKSEELASLGHPPTRQQWAQARGAGSGFPARRKPPLPDVPTGSEVSAAVSSGSCYDRVGRWEMQLSSQACLSPGL